MAHNSWLDNNSVTEHRGHIRAWLILLFFAMLPCRGAERQLSIPVVLYASFQVEPPPAIMEFIRDELAGIMSPMGFHIEWRSLSEAPGNPEAVELAVIKFKGRCDTSGNLSVFRNGGVLGLTHITDGVIVPFSDIDCDAIRAFLQKELWIRYSDTRPQMFGRAVARVLAHELYHIFARTTKHASCGLGKSTYTATELLLNEFRFEKADAIVLRKGKIMERPENARSIPNAGGAPGCDFN